MWQFKKIIDIEGHFRPIGQEQSNIFMLGWVNVIGGYFNDGYGGCWLFLR